jgi:FtsZ-binding cell division protein ZapB
MAEMVICDDAKHEQIVYYKEFQSTQCPLCLALDTISNLEHTNAELKEENESLKAEVSDLSNDLLDKAERKEEK